MKSTLVRKLFLLPAVLLPLDGLNVSDAGCGRRRCFRSDRPAAAVPSSSSSSSSSPELSLLLLSLLSLSSRMDACCFKSRARSFLCCACIMDDFLRYLSRSAAAVSGVPAGGLVVRLVAGMLLLMWLKLPPPPLLLPPRLLLLLLLLLLPLALSLSGVAISAPLLWAVLVSGAFVAAAEGPNFACREASPALVAAAAKVRRRPRRPRVGFCCCGRGSGSALASLLTLEASFLRCCSCCSCCSCCTSWRRS